MTPVRTGLLAAVAVWAGLAGVAAALGVAPGRPLATRTDVFFQSDAGGQVTDIATGADDRARGAHPVVYFVWTAPLHRLSAALAPGVPAEATALYGSLALVIGGCGTGIGVLAAGLTARGVRPADLAAVAPAYLLGTGQTLAAVPDHFGLSQGVLAAAFGVWLWPLPAGRKAALLVGLTLLAFGVTVTNALFPAGLLAVTVGRWQGRRGWLAMGAVAVLAAAAGAGLYLGSAGFRDRLDSRIELYLTWRLTRDPPAAAAHTVRGVIDAAVGPTPAVRTNNLDRLPMLTYDPPGEPYRAWPYDPVRSAAAAAWLALLAVGTARAGRGPAVAAWLWVGWNLLFHNVWGDEFFLYTPHYSWALAAVVPLGWRSPRLAPLALLTAAGGAVTLLEFRRLLAGIPV